MARYTVTVRSGSKVRRERFQELGDALAAMERRGEELTRSAERRPEGGGLFRKIEPVQQVAARLELRGPERLRAGVDVRGDGSSEAFIGRVRREVIAQDGDESCYAALRRTLRRS